MDEQAEYDYQQFTINSDGLRVFGFKEFQKAVFLVDEVVGGLAQFVCADRIIVIASHAESLSRNSIGSGKSRQSRDSDLLNGLAAKNSSKASSSKSLNKKLSERKLQTLNKSRINSSSNGSQSEQHEQRPQNKIQVHMMAPKIHNCVCFVAGECLNYNCNCFLSPYPCAPECCPNCLTLRSNLPIKVTNMCSCKKTKCLKLYCECLSKGEYCSIMCRCQLCENHEHSHNRVESISTFSWVKGCSCQKSHCEKKYCQCFNQNLKCTSKCVCVDCHNYLDVCAKQESKQKGKKKQPQIPQKMQQENNEMQPELQFEEINFFGSKKK